MKVKVIFYTRLLKTHTNVIEVELKDNDTLMCLIEKLHTTYSSDFNSCDEIKTRSIVFLVNGKNEKLNMVLRDGDVVSILPIVDGG